jgi:hypothetical protein
VSDRRAASKAASKARRKRGVRGYRSFGREHLMAGVLEALGFLRAIEPEHRDVEAAWQAFTDELLRSYELADGDVSLKALPRCVIIDETDLHEDR